MFVQRSLSKPSKPSQSKWNATTRIGAHAFESAAEASSRRVGRRGAANASRAEPQRQVEMRHRARASEGRSAGERIRQRRCCRLQATGCRLQATGYRLQPQSADGPNWQREPALLSSRSADCSRASASRIPRLAKQSKPAKAAKAASKKATENVGSN